jgi:membrane protein implicated in regulation of membrane protease activity
MTRSRKLVEREVRVDDPDLSPEANRLMTGELRDAIGSDRAQVPAHRADDAGRLPNSGRPTLGVALATNRVLIAITFAVLLIVGVTVSLATGSWWAVVAACAVHALGTLIIVTMALRISTQVEHMAPGTAARLQDEGVADPDRALSDLLEQYAPDDQARGTAEVVSSGHNRVTVEPEDDQHRAGLEQRSAITPAGSPVEPSEHRSAPAVLPVAAVVGSVVVSLGAAIAIGGVAWVAAAIMVAVSVAWLLLQWRMDGRAESDPDTTARSERQIGDTRAGHRDLLLPTTLIVVGAVIAGVVLVGALGGYL